MINVEKLKSKNEFLYYNLSQQNHFFLFIRKESNKFKFMWCCASKPDVKKPLRSAKEEPFIKVTLNLAENIRFQYKKKWQSNIQKAQPSNKVEKKPNQVDANQILEMQLKIDQIAKNTEQSSMKKDSLHERLKNQETRGQKLKEEIAKNKALQKVLEYMILKEQQNIDSYALKIKS